MWHCARDADCRPPERDPIFQMSRRQKAADSHRGRFSPSTKGGRDNLSPAAAAAVALYLYDCIGFSSGGRARLRAFPHLCIMQNTKPSGSITGLRTAHIPAAATIESFVLPKRTKSERD